MSRKQSVISLLMPSDYNEQSIAAAMLFSLENGNVKMLI
jgi:hypothetical protein